MATTPSTTVAGLTYYPDFINVEEEQKLVLNMDEREWSNDLSRRVQQYGYKYSYKMKNSSTSDYLGPVPDFLTNVVEKICELHQYFRDKDKQIIINEYVAGQGIAGHVDNPKAFGEVIVSLSLISKYPMKFEHVETGETVEIWLHPRSLLVLTGDARYKWKHCIVSRKNDILKGVRVPRGRRISLTMRTMK